MTFETKLDALKCFSSDLKCDFQDVSPRSASYFSIRLLDYGKPEVLFNLRFGQAASLTARMNFFCLPKFYFNQVSQCNQIRVRKPLVGSMTNYPLHKSYKQLKGI